MKLRFLKDWMRFKMGDVRDIRQPNLARELVKRGVAVPAVDEEDGAVMTAAIAPPQTAMRKRGRPRKTPVVSM